MNTDRQITKVAAQFARRRAEHGYEKGESQKFRLELPGNVFGVDEPEIVAALFNYTKNSPNPKIILFKNTINEKN